MDDLPDTGIEYSLRVIEVQCAETVGLEKWYLKNIHEREWLVAGRMLPGLVSTIQSMQSQPDIMRS
jgi:hypothetical protein